MTDVSEDGEIVPILQKSLLERLPILVTELNEADLDVETVLKETEYVRREAYTRRKACRNRLAECLKGLGLEQFTIGGDRADRG